MSRRQNNLKNNNVKPQIAAILKTLPERPGVYLMRDAQGKIIYVGKAIKLKRRVSSYFKHSGFASPRLRKLVSLIEDIGIIRTETEAEALIVEAKLIRRYAPFFNVDLKFNDRYPYIKVNLKDDFPRLEITRHKPAGDALFLGPFTRAGDLRELMRLIARYFPLRICKSDLKAGKIKARPCIEYHLGRSMGACAGLCTQEEYRERVNDIILLLEGKSAELINRLKIRMDAAAQNLDFEAAAYYRDAIRATGRVSRQRISSALQSDLDNETWQVLNDMQKILNLKILPWRIDAFDISHTSGHDTYGVCVVFEQGRPNKSLYRKFKIRSLADGEINDFQAIYETVYRRYKHVIDKSEPMPQLTLIDGGAGQLEYALRAINDLKNNFKEKLNIIALAEREEVIYVTHKDVIRLGLDNPVLQLLQRLRDEAHRFAITTHRRARNKIKKILQD